MLDIKRILIPVDFSNEARMAVEWAVFLLRKTSEASLILLHVFPYSQYADHVTWENQLDDHLLERRWDTERRELERWQENIPSPIRSDFIVGAGSVASAVRRACDRYKIDLVVMITRSRQGLWRMIRPNTSERVVRVAPCPVLVLHLDGKSGRRRTLERNHEISRV